MAKYITELNISSFRGIRNLELNNLSDINIFVGDNNSGKTSLLEAIAFFCYPTEQGILDIAQQRANAWNLFSIAENVFYFFYRGSKNEKDAKLNITGKFKEAIIQVDLQGSFSKEFVIQQNTNTQNFLSMKEEVSVFNGEIITQVNGIKNSKIIKLHKFIEIKNNIIPHINTAILTPISHAFINNCNALVQNKKLKDKAVKLLQFFDNSIKDIRLLPSEIHSIFIAIESDKADYIPLSLYGDGIKKALSLLNCAIFTENGILLIDEFETALHTSLMQEIFSFLITVAQELNIQLFMTTHNLEAVDKLLEASKAHLDNVRVIRLANREDKTYAGIIDGNRAYDLRKTYDTELRA